MRDSIPAREQPTLIERTSTLSTLPSYFRRISWGAIIGGVVAAVSILLLLNLLGIGIGASTIDPMEGDQPGKGMAIGAGIWFILSFLVALAIGGWTSGRLTGVPDRKDGMLHGFITWGVTTMILVWALTTAMGGLIGGATSLLGHTASLAGQSARSAAPAVSGLVQQATGITPQEIQRQAGDVASDPSFQSFVSGVLRDGQVNAQDRANLARVISQRRGISQADAEAQITQWQQQLAQTKQQVGQKAVQAEEKAASGVSRAALVSFAALLLGAIAATFGGGSGSPKFTAQESTQRETRSAA
ncbi:MAG TPA: hypothetical protein VJS37_11955 [Terriglobales bacterium]|nr:hypothetical protein [Terriglobales bacterium]